MFFHVYMGRRLCLFSCIMEMSHSLCAREHREHEIYFKEELSKEKIPHISEIKFREIYKTLWASARSRHVLKGLKVN